MTGHLRWSDKFSRCLANAIPRLPEPGTDDLYGVKFRGAGQRPKAVIAELVAGEIGRAIGLPVPEIVLLELDSVLARSEPDPESQELIRASADIVATIPKPSGVP